jgi:hypothetical protein
MTYLITPAGLQAGEYDRCSEAKGIWIDLSAIDTGEAVG